MKRVTLSRPEGAFYAFFAVDGMDDSVAFAQKLIDNKEKLGNVRINVDDNYISNDMVASLKEAFGWKISTGSHTR